MPLRTRITCYTAWANARCSSLSRQLNNIFIELFTDNHLKKLLESFTGKAPRNMNGMAQRQSKQNLIPRFELFLEELQKAGIIPKDSKIDCGLIAKKNIKSVSDLLWKLIVYDIRFTWERSSQLLLNNEKLVCAICFKWTLQVKSSAQKQAKAPPSFFAGLAFPLDETKGSSVSTQVESYYLQNSEPFPGHELAKAFNKKIPKEGWNNYPSAVECILDLINTHLQIAAKGRKLCVKDIGDLADSHVWCYLVNSFMPGTFIVEVLPYDRWTTNLALKTMEAIICISTSLTSQDLLEADPKALCAYLCVIFMCGYKFRQSIAVVKYIKELQLLKSKLDAQLQTSPLEELEPHQSAQKSDLEKKLEVFKNELSWLHDTYDVPFCQNWSELATNVQKQTKDTISKKMTERFEMVVVPRNMSLNDLCLTSAIAFTETNGFYLAVEKEIFPENRKLVLQNKNTKKFTEDFSGCQPNASVRKILKLPLSGVIEIDPNAYPDYNLFFESKTRNKKLKMNMRFLYEVFPANPTHWQRTFFQTVKNGDIEIVRNMVQFFKDSCLEILHSKESISGNGCLHVACRRGHFDIVQELLENGVSLDAKNATGSTPFFLAAVGQHRKICKLLIEWGCDVHIKNMKNHTAFDDIRSEEFKQFLLSYHAYISSAIPLIIQGDTDILHNMAHNLVNNINFLSSPTSRCINGSTLLHTAAYFGKIDIVKTLLYLKINVNLQDYKGATALHRSRDTETIQMLIEHGADVNWSDGDGNTPLHMMCYGEMKKPARLDCLKLMLSHKATIEILNKKDLLPIHCAAIQGRIDVIELLLQFDVEEQTRAKLMTAKAPSVLYLSVASDHIECAEWLKSKGFLFKPEELKELVFGLLQDEMGAQGKAQCLEFLLRNGIDINAVNKQGDSALHLAALKGDCNDLLMLLLLNNAEVNILNRGHSTPLCYAVQASNYYGASLLIQHGVNIKEKNNQGFSAFDLIQDYHEWIDSGLFTEEIISVFKVYELERSCSLVRNINRKLKAAEASQQLSLFNYQMKQNFL
ncbi:uncharacterized protein LOC116984113 [Amblyraja radiata]|uniref:uncharacterized protein LOC116984113 n=1 Tax=Amblyraja radiata TaxID=386614 RepID=UPI0014041BFF|nr:uncharacterized protein LOC116984113 [Amblyraja radiata]